MQDGTSHLNDVCVIAFKAGKAILDIYSSEDSGGNAPFGETLKSDNSPLTRADLASHRIILAGLGKLTPSIPVLSEESEEHGYALRSRWQSYWLVDPLDGTKEFIKRNGEFTVNIALIAGSSPVLGVVLAPALGISYYAERGKGAFKRKDGKTARIKAAGYDGGKVRIVGSRSHSGPELEAFVKRIGEAEFVSMGSSLKLCLVAEGAADIYPRFGPTMEWDTAAAQCVVEEAGGAVTDLKGMALRYNKEDLLNPNFIVAGNPPFPWKRLVD